MRPDLVDDVLVQIISNLICQLIYWLASNLLALLKKSIFYIGGRGHYLTN